jgi:hypothetical protein
MLVCTEFNTTQWGGTKALFISTTTTMGGKNSFLPILYLVLSGILVACGILFTVMTMLYPRQLGDHRLLPWNQEVTMGRTTGATGSTPATGLSRRAGRTEET